MSIYLPEDFCLKKLLLHKGSRVLQFPERITADIAG